MNSKLNKFSQRKLRSMMFIGIAIFSIISFAEPLRVYVLPDGNNATVMSEMGTYRTYIRSATTWSDGNIQVNPDHVFIGERVVRKSDGQCIKIINKLMKMERVTTIGVTIESPEINLTAITVDCPSPTQN